MDGYQHSPLLKTLSQHWMIFLWLERCCRHQLDICWMPSCVSFSASRRVSNSSSSKVSVIVNSCYAGSAHYNCLRLGLPLHSGQAMYFIYLFSHTRTFFTRRFRALFARHDRGFFACGTLSSSRTLFRRLLHASSRFYLFIRGKLNKLVETNR